MVEHCIGITPGFFCCHQVYSVVKRDLLQCSNSSTRPTLAVSVREELRKWKPKPGEAHFPCFVVTLRKEVLARVAYQRQDGNFPNARELFSVVLGLFFHFGFLSKVEVAMAFDASRFFFGSLLLGSSPGRSALQSA